MISNSCGNGVGADAAMMLCQRDIRITIAPFIYAYSSRVCLF